MDGKMKVYEVIKTECIPYEYNDYPVAVFKYKEDAQKCLEYLEHKEILRQKKERQCTDCCNNDCIQSFRCDDYESDGEYCGNAEWSDWENEYRIVEKEVFKSWTLWKRENS